ncbi:MULTISPECIES: cation:proton antiporter [unclassified Mesorhizobium]|uniref:cation:proton antiporter domain-containing protein n=1 Tax=unclassified Mesorhizobium TaxID=325217 RepID=UPI00112A807F|nr:MULTISPECIES: cation:proton antiporter [unclassified Mesorhizobium]TPI19920.1 potassium transporter [Mesorhizobium sp. B4-1-1]TPL50000.1 potassium transporter [Mesorhizobium sp. B2-4-6]
MPAVAFAAEKTGMSSEGIFVAEVILLLVVGRGIGEVLEILGQPAVMGQLIGGILLGPSLLGWVWPAAERLIFAGDPSQKSMINAIAQLGVLMLLLLTGMETDLRLVRRVGRACFSISAAGVAIPFALGFVAAQFMPATLLAAGSERIVAGLFLGTALSISSVKIVAMVVRDMNFMRRDLGQIIVSSAIIEDTIGWVIIAITIGIATKGRIEIGSLAFTIAGVAAFMAFSFTLGRRIVFDAIRWTNDTFRSEYAVVTVILAIMGAMALITDLIGVHTVLGAFVAGILVGESPILSRHIEGQLRGIITALFMPVFFGVAGLSADLTVLIDPQLALLTVALVVIASIGKFGGAFIGAEVAGMSRAEGIAVGCGMNARGSTEVIVASIGLSMGVLSHNLFTMIVTMAVITTLIMPPTLRWALRRLPMGEKEKKRLEREEVDQRGFVAGLERLLVVVDEGVVGRFAAYLAGVIGAGKPTTVLHSSGEIDAEPTEGLHLEEIEKGAEDSREAAKKGDETPAREAPVTRRQHEVLSAEAVAKEARKGYGMLLVGLGRAVTPKGGFSHRLNEVAGAFDGPLCLVLKPAAAGRQMPRLGPGSGKILVPVNGTAVARRGAELALAIAAVTGAPVKMLYVARVGRDEPRDTVSHRRREAVLKDIVALADRYGVEIETAIRSRAAAADAIARQAGRSVALIVMGVARRQGEELIFGETTTAVLRRGPCPVVLISDERVKRDESDREAVRTGTGNG